MGSIPRRYAPKWPAYSGEPDAVGRNATVRLSRGIRARSQASFTVFYKTSDAVHYLGEKAYSSRDDALRWAWQVTKAGRVVSKIVGTDGTTIRSDEITKEIQRHPELRHPHGFY